MGKQINFFMLPQDVAEIDAKVKELGLTIIADRMPTQQLIVLDSLVNDYDKLYLLLPNEIKNIPVEYIAQQQTYWIPALQIQGIEYKKSIYFAEENLLIVGRIIYQTEYFDNQNNFLPINNDLKQKTEYFTKWLKKYCNKKIEGYYIGKNTYSLVLKDKIILKSYTKILTTN